MEKSMKQRSKNIEDFYETPSNAILPILKYIPDGVKKIWEPTTGRRGITKYLENYEVIETDKFPKVEGCRKFDFLTDEPDFEYDMIIFNPPFCLKTEFLQRVVSLNKPFLFIAPQDITGTKTRFNIFREHKLSVINLDKRVQYLKDSKSGSSFNSVWVLNDGKSSMYFEEI